jgi:hypothetical protein
VRWRGEPHRKEPFDRESRVIDEDGPGKCCPLVGELGKKGKLEHSGKSLIQRCSVLGFQNENGLAASRERDFESLPPRGRH